MTAISTTLEGRQKVWAEISPELRAKCYEIYQRRGKGTSLIRFMASGDACGVISRLVMEIVWDDFFIDAPVAHRQVPQWTKMTGLTEQDVEEVRQIMMKYGYLPGAETF